MGPRARTGVEGGVHCGYRTADGVGGKPVTEGCEPLWQNTVDVEKASWGHLGSS
jgi:hypothetical protein